MKIGNISFNVAAFKDYTKEQFFAEFKGKLTEDKEIVWKRIVKLNGKNESTCEFGESVKKHNGKRTTDSTKSK